MVGAAHRAGLREICVTDHCDLQTQDGSPLKSWDWEPILTQFQQVKARYGSELRLALGLELGGGQTDAARAERILAAAPLDFVIGSVHNMSPAAGGKDLFALRYSTVEESMEVLEDYVSCLLALAPLSCYDALGHILYPLRYINGRAGHQLTFEPFSEQMDEVLRTVIATGKSIELNTHGGRQIREWLPLLRRYHELGGELVTMGSDAHRPNFVGEGLVQAAWLLREAGFRYVTLYRRRVPKQMKLWNR
jgi:histidinol-phosphatase (PHP family)